MLEVAESSFSYAVELYDTQTENHRRRVDRAFRFQSGDRFKLALRPDFDAYVYLFHRTAGDHEFEVLYPTPRIGVRNPLPGGLETRIPDGDVRWTLDSEQNMEHLVLVVAVAPWDMESSVGRSTRLDDFEQVLAELEMSRRPRNYSLSEADGWTNVVMDGEPPNAAFALRLALKRE